jgi:hypothetical protein
MALERDKIISKPNIYTYCFRLSEIVSFFEEKIDKILESIKDYDRINIKIEDADYNIVSTLCELYKNTGWNVSYTFRPGSLEYKERDYYILTFN